MKKRLLITSALMTAVLGASLATGTYAWYQVSAGGLAAQTKVSGQVGTKVSATVDGPAFTAANITITLGVSLDLSKADGTAKYYDKGGATVEYSASHYTSGVFATDATIAIDLSPLTESTYAGNYTITVTGTEKVRVAKEATANASKATCVGENTSIVLTVVIANDGTASVSAEDQAKVNDFNLSGDALSFKVKYSVGPNGETDAATDAESTAEHGTVSVTVVSA